MDMLNKNLNSMATEEKDINDQKAKLQGEAQMGEEAAEIAAKLPVSPETVIEGIMFARKARETLAANIVPIMGVLAVLIAGIAYEVYATKNKKD